MAGGHGRFLLSCHSSGSAVWRPARCCRVWRGRGASAEAAPQLRVGLGDPAPERRLDLGVGLVQAARAVGHAARRDEDGATREVRVAKGGAAALPGCVPALAHERARAAAADGEFAEVTAFHGLIMHGPGDERARSAFRARSVHPSRQLGRGVAFSGHTPPGLPPTVGEHDRRSRDQGGDGLYCRGGGPSRLLEAEEPKPLALTRTKASKRDGTGSLSSDFSPVRSP